MKRNNNIDWSHIKNFLSDSDSLYAPASISRRSSSSKLVAVDTKCPHVRLPVNQSFRATLLATPEERARCSFLHLGGGKKLRGRPLQNLWIDTQKLDKAYMGHRRESKAKITAEKIWVRNHTHTSLQSPAVENGSIAYSRTAASWRKQHKQRNQPHTASVQRKHKIKPPKGAW